MIFTIRGRACLCLCVLLTRLTQGALAADELPKNQVPSLPAEIERLRKTSREQQLYIADLKSQVERLSRELDDLKGAKEAVARLQGALDRERTQTEAMRKQLVTLEREVYRPRGNKRELVGAWKVVSIVENGAKNPQAVTRLVFTPSSVTFHQKDPGRERVYTYKVDPDAEPKELDVFGGEFRPTLAIYRIEGDRLTLCVDHRLTARPTEFQSTPESSTSLWTLERESRPKAEGATLHAATATTRLARGLDIQYERRPGLMFNP